MPSSIVVGLVYALSAVAAGGTWAAVAAAFISATLASAALSVLSSALIKKPSNQATTSLSQARTVTTRQAAAPRRVIYGEMRVGGTIVYMDARDNVGGTQWLNIVIALAGHEVEEIGDIYFDDYKLQLDGAGEERGRYLSGGASYVHVWKHLGSPDQTADRTLISLSGGKWTENHRLRGIAYLYVVLAQNVDLFPTGVPNITAIVKGKKVFDPRTSFTVWNDNAALCVADYLADTKYGPGAAYGSEIDLGELITAANVCDEVVGLADGTTEHRYTCNGMFETDARPADIIEQLLTAMSGKCSYVGGVWRVMAAAWRTPESLALDTSDLRGSLKISTRLPRREIANAVKGVYVSPDNKWQTSDFPPVTNDTYQEEDQGERIWRDIQLPFTTSGTMAQRIAKIELERIRQQISVVAPCKLSAYRVKVGDVLPVTNVRMGWTNKPFEVLNSTLAFSDDGTVGIDLTLRETAAGVFDWNSGEETTVDLAADSDLPDPFTIDAPGTPVISETLYQAVTTLALKVQVLISCSPSASAFIAGYQFEYQALGDTEWTVSPVVNRTDWVFSDLEAGYYLFRVKAVSTLGVSSPYSDIVNKEIFGLQAPPADVTGFYVIKSSGVAIANWNLHADLDVKVGGKIEIGYASATTGATWNNAISLGLFAGNGVSGVLPLKTGTYFAKAIDSSGNYSTNAVSFVVTEGMVTGFTTVASLTESPTFSGGKTGVAVNAGSLVLSSGVMFDSIAGNFDSITGLFDNQGTQVLVGTYTFSSYIDLSTVATRRVEAGVTAVASDNGDLFDSKTGLFDSIGGLFDGDELDDADVKLYFAATNDDPAGTPTWGPWTPFVVSDVTARALKFKAELIVGTVNHNIAISALSVAVKT